MGDMFKSSGPSKPNPWLQAQAANSAMAKRQTAAAGASTAPAPEAAVTVPQPITPEPSPTPTLQPPTESPAAPPPAAVTPPQAPASTKPQRKSMQTSFLGAGTTPKGIRNRLSGAGGGFGFSQSAPGTKTLLGQ